MGIYQPVSIAYSIGEGAPEMDRWPEAATQTFKRGAPLELVSGYLQEADFGGADVIVGFAMEDAHNLTVAGTGETLSAGVPINQTSASIIPMGAPLSDGNIGFYKVGGRNKFQAHLELGDVFTQALVASGTFYTLEKDATTGIWFIDIDETSGNDAIVKIEKLLDPGQNSATTGARVVFSVLPAQAYFTN